MTDLGQGRQQRGCPAARTQYIDALAPSNFAATNPEFIQSAATAPAMGAALLAQLDDPAGFVKRINDLMMALSGK